MLFAIARQTQFTPREVRSRIRGRLSLNATGVSVDYFFEGPHAVVSRRESLSHRIGCEIIPSPPMTTTCVVI